MAADPAVINFGDGEMTRALLTAGPAGQPRGRVPISGERKFLRECRFIGTASPAPGLSPSGIASAIAAAGASAAGKAR
jgi:hypothetical protein